MKALVAIFQLFAVQDDQPSPKGTNVPIAVPLLIAIFSSLSETILSQITLLKP
jgi:hypothetical protein